MSDEKADRLQRKIVREVRKLQKQIVRHIDVVEHAKIVRKELKKKFPTTKFRVRSERFPGGSSVDVYPVGELSREQEREVEAFVNRFNGYRSGTRDDMYNVGFIYEGERISGALFCSYWH